MKCPRGPALVGLLISLSPIGHGGESRKLVELAQQAFSDSISRAEEEVFLAAENGRQADCSFGNESNLDEAPNWPPDRIVDANKIVWLCSDLRAGKLVSRKGVEIRGARIEHTLDLDGVRVPFSIRTYRCYFTNDISLNRTNLWSLELQATVIQKLKGEGLKIDRDLLLISDFVAKDTVVLPHAVIGGWVNCDGATFDRGPSEDKDARALNLDSATIGTGLSLRRVHAAGAVVLANCKIDGLLNLEGAKLNGIAYSRHWDNALYAESISVKGHVWLRGDFNAHGPVVLSNATIDGNLDCGSGKFSQPGDKALVADMSQIRGSIYLTDGFQATGEVDLHDAVIGHDLSCKGGQFIVDSEKTKALNGVAVKVGGSARLGDYGNYNIFKSTVEVIVDLTDASIQNTLFLTGATDLREANLYLSRARVGTLSNQTSMWPNKLRLNEFLFDALDQTGNLDSSKQKQWLLLNKSENFQSQPYQQMATVLRRLGQEDDASEILIEKNARSGDQMVHEDERRLLTGALLNLFPLSIDWIWYKVLGKAIGFGYQAWTAFFASVALVLIGWRLFRFAYNRDVMVPTSEDASKDKRGDVSAKTYNPPFNAFIYSLETFLPLLELGIRKVWGPSSHESAEVRFRGRRIVIPGRFFQTYLWVHICAGWVLTTLWIGAFTGILKL